MLIDLASWYKDTLAPKIEALRGAMDDHRVVRFSYFAPGGESQRAVEPYYLVFHWSAWYLWGWCQSREDFRLFKLVRMTELSVGEEFAPREAPLPDFNDARIFPSVYQAVVRFSPRCKWRLVEEYGPESFTIEPEGTLLFRWGFPDVEGLLGWVLTFGDGAELLEPAELRENLAHMLRRTLAHYEQKEE